MSLEHDQYLNYINRVPYSKKIEILLNPKLLWHLVQKCRLRLLLKPWKPCMLFSHLLAQMSTSVISTALEIELYLRVNPLHSNLW